MTLDPHGARRRAAAALGALLAFAALVPPAAPQLRPRSGSARPAGRSFTPEAPRALASEVLDVPAYVAVHGSAPTAAAMVLAYHALHGFPQLLPGDVTVQSELIDAAIASPEHYLDYGEPLDARPSPMPDPPVLPAPDKSEPPEGDEHPDNCLADYLGTSQSVAGNFYTETLSSDLPPGLMSYAREKTPYRLLATFNRQQNVQWWTVRNEILSGRPMIFQVDPEGVNSARLFVAVVGFRTEDGVNWCACLDTRDRDLHWFPFREIGEGVPFGVHSVYAVVVTHAVFPPVDARVRRLVNDYLFFKEIVNRLTWAPNPANLSRVVRTKIFRKHAAARDSEYALLAELDVSQRSFDDRGLHEDDAYAYRLTFVDEFGHESPAAVAGGEE